MKKKMINDFLSRRKFINIAKLSLLLLISACRNFSDRVVNIAFQKQLYPLQFLDIIPNFWNKKAISYEKFSTKINFVDLENTDLLLINDGWLNRVNFDDFENIHASLISKLDERSKFYLNNFEESKRRKLMPIGINPYVVIIKNNKNHQIENNDSWDFLFSKDLKGKVILPQSTRIVLSIMKRIKNRDLLQNIVNQKFIYEDKNALDLLVNTDAAIAITPLSLSQKYLKIDSRLSILFPNDGVPLLWNFAMIRSSLNREEFNNWIDLLLDPKTVNRLAKAGWYLPFQTSTINKTYNDNLKQFQGDSLNPSKRCWDNSWSFSPLNFQEKKELEILGNNLLTP
tara:strand:- start:695 stop:1717 length:1023 start_codon:yes stop_codon:yes gene_type:complete